jgi:hypothetical protein
MENAQNNISVIIQPMSQNFIESFSTLLNTHFILPFKSTNQMQQFLKFIT